MVLLESLAAIGCVFLLWSVFGSLFRPRAALPAVLVLPIGQDTADLEQSLRWVRFLRKAGLFNGTVLLLKQGTAVYDPVLPAMRDDQVELIGPDELNTYFIQERA